MSFKIHIRQNSNFILPYIHGRSPPALRLGRLQPKWYGRDNWFSLGWEERLVRRPVHGDGVKSSPSWTHNRMKIKQNNLRLDHLIPVVSFGYNRPNRLLVLGRYSSRCPIDSNKKRQKDLTRYGCVNGIQKFLKGRLSECGLMSWKRGQAPSPTYDLCIYVKQRIRAWHMILPSTYLVFLWYHKHPNTTYFPPSP